ncbi:MULTISPECIES: AAA family ATPase [Rhodococcus]|uniref:AAA family ATPase n=1 Tax=Rhodococcus TaxID=1827 RepID=UPI000C9BECA2|nr:MULTISPECIES: AAA family ATPase [Rhodococcus]PND53626.1 ATPase [Rhodococcus sp. ENV425]WKW98903.1 AAA family ATPase [Rhodococcus aetherivorans]
MGGTAEFRDTLVQLVRARHPVLLVETHEEERVLSTVRSLAMDLTALPRPRNVLVYTLSNGLHVCGGEGKPMQPAAALTAARKTDQPTIFVFCDLHHFLGSQSRGPDPELIRALIDTANAFKSGAVPHTLVLVAPGLTLPLDLEKIITMVDLPLPDIDEVADVLDSIVTANAANISIRLTDEERHRLLQAALGLTRWEAENAFARAISSDRVLDADDIALVLDEKRQTIRKSGLLEFIPPSGSLDDIGGLEVLKQWLRKRNGSWLADAAEWSIPAPKGILITGVPGCGKSLTAKCMSTLWGLPLLRLDIGRVFSGLVGSSEQNMRGALRLAEAVSPSILWIDEIEKGFGSSASGGDSGTGQRVFGTFLTWMQEKSKPVFVVATANRIESLPAEFLRKGRFDEIFFVDLPTETERIPIWRLHIGKRIKQHGAGPVVQPTDHVAALLAAASEGFSGAEIEQAVISASFDAFADRRNVALDDLQRAIANTVPLSTTQAEKIAEIREWAATRAVAATAPDDRAAYASTAPQDSADVETWRGGRTFEF